MTGLIYILISLLTFFLMEIITWCTHKFVMHGLMWYFHKDHHQPQSGFFEKNDFFFVIFAIPSWLCIMLGLMYQHYNVACIGAGIALYGLAYFLVHDLFIHQRFHWLKNSNSVYLCALRKAHKVHHKHLGKEDGECFGMLWVPRKYFKEARESINRIAESRKRGTSFSHSAENKLTELNQKH